MWAKEALRGLKNNLLFSLLVILQLSVGLILVNILVQNMNTFQASYPDNENLQNQHAFYTLTDPLYGEEEDAYYKGSNGLNRLKPFIHELEENALYTYYICGTYPVAIGSVQYNTKHAGQRLMSDFPIRLKEGRLFRSEEYVYRNGVIPIIIGPRLSTINNGGEIVSTYAVGQQLTGYYFGMLTTYQVVGMAAENSHFPISDTEEYLDQYIIIPALRFDNPPTNEKESMMQKEAYRQYASGTFRLSGHDQFGALTLFLDTLRNKYGIFEMSFIDLKPAKLSFFLFTFHEQAQLVSMLTTMACLFALASIGMMMDVSVRQSTRRYAVLLIYGASFRQIACYVIGEAIVSLFFASMAAIGALAWFFGEIVSISMPVFFAALVLCVLCTLPGLCRLVQNELPQITKEVV